VRPGFCADLTVFGEDPVDCDRDELPANPVLLTVVDGEVVFRVRKRERRKSGSGSGGRLLLVLCASDRRLRGDDSFHGAATLLAPRALTAIAYASRDDSALSLVAGTARAVAQALAVGSVGPASLSSASRVEAHDGDALFRRHQVGPQGGMHGEPVCERV
jgi:hypothetical protein